MKTILSFKDQIKGNLHTHTTRTDGQFSVDEVVEKYKEKAYRFIGITDHRLYYRQDCTYEDMVILNGCEYNCYLENETLEETVHFHILALEDRTHFTQNPIMHDDNSYKKLFYRSLEQVQGLIDELRQRGNLIIIAHPKNFKIPLDVLLKLDGYDGIEVYNAKAKSDASDYVHACLVEGKDIFFTAVDDAHRYLDDEGHVQYFKGCIILEDGALNKGRVIEAIKDKRFYGSNGPMIEEIALDGSMVSIKTSDVEEINLFLYGDNGSNRMIKKRDHGVLNGASFSVPTDIRFVRLECIRGDGKKAWTNKLCITL